MPLTAMTRTPFGAMNQDDSLVTPAKDQAGRNMFQVGDYRYALNARIGSSRSDAFGDLETIRDTVEVTDYYGYEELFENGDFTGSPDAWLQLDEGSNFKTWIFGADYARLTVIPDSVSPKLTYGVSNFSAPSDSGNWPPSMFTQANFPNAFQFTVGQVVTFQDAPDYPTGYIVMVSSGFFVFQHTYVGDNPGASVEYGDGPPSYVTTSFISRVLYQTVEADIAGLTLNLKFVLDVVGAITNGALNIVYMQDDTILQEVPVDTGFIGSISYNQSVTIPENCNGIGIRLEGDVITEMTATLQLLTISSSHFTQIAKPAGNEKTIGRFEDYEFQRLYYCVWNDQDNHCLRYWDAVENIIVEVIRWSGFNWLSDTFVKMAKLDNWMALTDRRNPPRLMDVDTISALRATLGDDFREFHISFHKWAPTVPAIPRIYYDGETNNYDKLKDKLYHFSYRYIYYGELKSRWSPISKGCTVFNLKNTHYGNGLITSIEIDIPGCILDQPGATGVAYNYFGHTDPKFIAAVKSIEIAFRDGELELWKLWKRIPVNESFDRLQYFTGDGLLTPIDQDEFRQPFDTVPFLAGTVEAIDNRFMFGDCLDEKDPVTNLQVDDVQSIYGLDKWNNPRTTSFAQFADEPKGKLQRFNALSNLTFKDRTLIKFGIQFIYPAGWRTGTYTSEDWLYTIPDSVGLSSGIDNVALNFTIPSVFRPPDGAVAYQIMRTNSLNLEYFMFGVVNRFRPIIDDLSKILDQLDLPDSIKDRIRQHFDNNNNIMSEEVIAQTQKILEAEIAESDKKEKKKKRRNRTRIRLNSLFSGGTVNVGHHLLDKALHKWRGRIPIGTVLRQELRKSKEINSIANASRILIDVNNWYFGAKEAADKEFPLNKLFYNYAEGDRLRFVGSDVANPESGDLKEYDVPILEFTGQSIVIEKPEGLQWISSVLDASPQNFIIEVYTPKRSIEQDHIFYEMGEWYPILYPGTGDRDFAKRDFVWENEAAVTLSQHGPFDIFHKIPVYFGDAYNVGKTVYRDKIGTGGTWVGASSAPMFVSMNPDINQTFGDWDKNNGRVSIAYEDLPVVRFKPTQVRFTGKILEESFVNALNRMDDEDQFIYPSEYGRIRDLVNTSNAQVESVGAILLAIGEREAWSIYVNRTTLEDLSGRSQVSLSEDVLGSYNTLLGSHGTLNPESVCRNRGRVWWWNAIDGSWIRYGRDGLTEISEYKMRNWFSELGDLMITKYQTSVKPTAIAEFDPFNRELITYQHHHDLPATFRGYAHFKGAMFSEEDTSWKSIHTFDPEMMGKMNNQVIMFKNGAPFLYEKGQGYNTFFGSKFDVQWEPVFNDDAHLKKAFKAFTVVATNRWSVERILSEYRGLKTRQQSRIKIENFEEREDNFYAAIPRDMNTPNGGVNAIIEGDVMRSKAIQVLMQLDPTVNYRSLLHYVIVQLTDSPLNP